MLYPAKTSYIILCHGLGRKRGNVIIRLFVIFFAIYVFFCTFAQVKTAML